MLATIKYNIIMHSRIFLMDRLINKIQEGKPIIFVVPKETRFFVSHQESRICIFSHKPEAIELTKENADKVIDDLKVTNEELYNIIMDLYY